MTSALFAKALVMLKSDIRVKLGLLSQDTEQVAIFIEIIAPTIMTMKLDMVARPTEQNASLRNEVTKQASVTSTAHSGQSVQQTSHLTFSAFAK